MLLLRLLLLFMGGGMIDYWRAIREYYLVVTFHPNKKQNALITSLPSILVADSIYTPFSRIKNCKHILRTIDKYKQNMYKKGNNIRCIHVPLCHVGHDNTIPIRNICLPSYDNGHDYRAR
jgi:hypothetical protein